MEKVHKISIVPRGRALGYTLNLPEEDRYLKSREELVDYMVALLGGRVAEHVVFGAVTTGASDDLRKVHDISRAMVVDYAMGSGLGTRAGAGEDFSISDATRRLVDEEQQDITEMAHRRALELIVRAPRPARRAGRDPAGEGDARPRGHRANRGRQTRRVRRRAAAGRARVRGQAPPAGQAAGGGVRAPRAGRRQ